MSDIAECLLVQYYGYSKESKASEILIHECANSVENDANELIDEPSTVHTNGNISSKETQMQANVESEERTDFEFDIPARSSRTLKSEVFEDKEEISEFDIFKASVTSDSCEKKTSILFDKKTRDFVLYNDKPVCSVTGRENKEGNDDLYLSISEDALPDSASDVSSVAGEKKPNESSNRFISLLSTPSNKTVICNETFIDLTNSGLTSLPIEMIGKYPTIRMLYLENNNLLELPKELFLFLTHLQWLDVRNNHLTNLPTSIQSHSSLESLLLQGNKIEKLPLELCLLPKLKILNVAHNPIAAPPKNIIALGCSSILNYLRTEWNKMHPDKPVTFVEQKIEAKPSTILCYRSPREKRRKLLKIPRRISENTNDIGSSFKDAFIKKRRRTYRPSDRYVDTRIDTFLKNSINVSDACNNDVRRSLCASCVVRNIAAVPCKDESNEKENDSNDKTDNTRNKRYEAQHTFLKIITSCYDAERTCIAKEIVEVDAKILHLTGPSPRSCYVRRNVMGLITYKHYRGKECRIKTISNETKHIALAKSNNSVVFNEEKKKCRNTKHVELIFDIITKDMQRIQLRPMQLKDSRCMLSCLNNFFGIQTD